MSSGDDVDAPATEGAAGGAGRERFGRARARIGQWVNGKWKLAELLGLGGTAAVYAATHRNGARVAIKVMHAEFASDVERCARFQREGYAANLIQHPGVVSIHDDGIDEHGQPFLVMELLQGASLQTLLGGKAKGLPPETVFDWALTLLEILERAHAKKVLHRDIKPSNLFLDDRGRVRVLDFGLAGGVAFESSATTVSGSILGTPAFMSPEQARGDWSAVDARSDLWATGATLFTLLTGDHVHPARTAQEQLGMAMMVSPRSLKKAQPELPSAIVEVVDRALCFEPERRWQSAREMASAVRRLGFGCSSGHTPASLDEVVADLPGPAVFLDQRIDTQRTATFSLESAPKSALPEPTTGRFDTRLAWGGLGFTLALVIGAIAASQGVQSRRSEVAPAAKKPPVSATSAASSTSAVAVAPRASGDGTPSSAPAQKPPTPRIAPPAGAKTKGGARLPEGPAQLPSRPAATSTSATKRAPSNEAAVRTFDADPPRSSGRLSDRLELEQRE
jgi:serine/threonine-protein kinase